MWSLRPYLIPHVIPELADIIEAYSVFGGTHMYNLHGHTHAVLGLTEVDNSVMSVSGDGTIRQWDLLHLPQNVTRQVSVITEDTPVWTLCRHHNIYSSCENVMWVNGVRHHVPVNHGLIWSLIVLRDDLIGIGYSFGGIQLFNVSTQSYSTLCGHHDKITAFAILPDSFVSGSIDATIKRWDYDTHLMATWCQPAPVNDLIVHDNILIIALANNTVREYNISLDMYVFEYRLDQPPMCLGMLADTTLIVAAGNHIHAYSPAGYTTYPAHTSQIRSLTVYQDNIVTGSEDGEIKVWSS